MKLLKSITLIVLFVPAMVLIIGLLLTTKVDCYSIEAETTNY